MLEVKNLNLNIANKNLLNKVSFRILDSSILQILGKNGIGKTSFLKSLVNLLSKDSGDIFWGDKNITEFNTGYYNSISYLSHKNYLNELLTVKENLEYSYKILSNKFNKDDFIINLKNILEKLDISNKQNTAIWKLSQGQKRKVALARIFLSNKKLWILDEPFVSLDVNSQNVVWDFLVKHVTQNQGIVIFTSHQPVLNIAKDSNIKFSVLDLDKYKAS